MTDPIHRVHGMAADSVPADWPVLTTAEVTKLLHGYPQIDPVHGIRWHSPRPLSAAGVVETADGAVFVKRHHRRVRTAATLAEEHRFMAHLRRGGLPVAEVLADARGHTAVAAGEWTYEVHAHSTGIDLYRETLSWVPLDDLSHAYTAGNMLARLHDAAASYRAAQRDTHILVARSELIEAVDPVACLQMQLLERPGLADYLSGRDWHGDLARVLGPVHRRLQPQLQSQPRLWTHNDWHASNLTWGALGRDAQIATVLDFGLASRTFALFDLATAIERNAIAWLALDTGDAAVRIDTAQALITGYCAQRPLDRHDLHLLADLLPLVHVDFALSEVEYFHAITGSRGNADIAYDTFLCGHAAWFAGAPGQALLQAVRDSD